MNVKKKALIALAAVVSAAVLLVGYGTGWFTRGKISGRFYRVDNVYEELWNLVLKESHGTKTVLASVGDRYEVDYDFGFFEQINLDRVSLNWFYNRRGERCLSLFVRQKEKMWHYVYDDSTHTLYGEAGEELLAETLLFPYFDAAGDSSGFSADDRGEYTFVLSDPIYENYPDY